MVGQDLVYKAESPELGSFIDRESDLTVAIVARAVRKRTVGPRFGKCGCDICSSNRRQRGRAVYKLFVAHVSPARLREGPSGLCVGCVGPK